MATIRRRLLGLAFFIVVVMFFVVTITKFNNGFASYSDVTLKTDSTGNALPQNADVKARGVVVGQVSKVQPAPDGSVDVSLNLTPSMAKELPASTTARILPKTLFGERYVALETPQTVQPGESGGRTLADGGTIHTDASGNAEELQQLFDRLLPILKAIPPQDLNVTLTSLSRALQGRGEQLGQALDDLNDIFSSINQKENFNALKGTLRGLASFSKTYSTALPDVIDALDNFRTTSNTIAERQGDLRSLISTLGTASTDTTKFLQDNRADLINLTIDAKPLLVGLAKQSPTFTCTFANFAKLLPKIPSIVGEGTKNPGAHVDLDFVNPRGRYLPNQDEPRFFDLNPPAICYQAASNGRPYPQYPGGPLADGSYHPPSRNPGPRSLPSLPQPQFSATPVGTIRANPYDDPDFVKQLKVIYGANNGTDPKKVPTWITTIGGAGLQGAQVTIR